MKRTRLVRTVCLVLALLMTATLIIPLVFQSFAAGSLQESQDALKALQEERKAIEERISANKDTMQQQTDLKQEYVNKRNNILAQIEVVKQQIADAEVALDAKQVEIGDKILQVADTQQLYDDRMVDMYVSKNEDPLAVLFGARSFSALLRYNENLNKMAQYDTELLALLRTQQAELEQQKKDLEAILAERHASEANLDKLNADYAASIQQADANISAEGAALVANEAAYEQNYEDEQKAKKEIETWMNANNNVNFEYGGGTFNWPCPGFTGYSSGFGNRNLWGRPDFHRGVDMRASIGTPVYAAADGVAATQNMHWSYGNCVKLSHGSGLVTLYAHMSQIAVAEGAFVARGDLVGYVGMTGNTSGPHLHFEVNLNGTPVSPMPYLNG